MTKSKTHKSSDIIRKQKKSLKALRKEVSRSKKRETRFVDLEEKEAAAFIEEEKALDKVGYDACPSCGRNTLEAFPLGSKVILFMCSESTCDHRFSKRSP